MDRLRIILADEQLLFCDMAARVLEPEFEVVGTVCDGPSLLAAASLGPEVVVVDVALPGLAGAAGVRSVHALSPSTLVIVLTMVDDATVARAALDAGASAYLLKTGALEELPEAIRNAARGVSSFSGNLAARLSEADAMPRSASLTEREHQVLELLVDGKPMREVAEILHLTPRTVAFHKYRIMKKLDAHSSAQLIRVALSRALAR